MCFVVSSFGACGLRSFVVRGYGVVVSSFSSFGVVVSFSSFGVSLLRGFVFGLLYFVLCPLELVEPCSSMSNSDIPYSWVDGRREWWGERRAERVAKLRRALSLCGGSDSRSLFAYDIVHESVADGPKGYVVVGRDWLPCCKRKRWNM